MYTTGNNNEAVTKSRTVQSYCSLYINEITKLFRNFMTIYKNSCKPFQYYHFRILLLFGYCFRDQFVIFFQSDIQFHS